jgi:hypothetical protein
MRVESWIFGLNAAFFALVTPVYWYMSEDWTGTSALVMTTGLTLLVTFYLGFTAQRMRPRPEDRVDAEVSDGAGELGFFSPHSWWPLYSALALTVAVLGVIFGWWLFIIGVGLGTVTLSGFIFEYYRGEHAH